MKMKVRMKIMMTWIKVKMVMRVNEGIKVKM